MSAVTGLTTILADLDFEVAVEGRAPVHGSLRSTGGRLVLDVDDASAFAGGADAPAVRSVARALAERGIKVRVVQGERHLITLGDVRAPWWQRLGTQSRHIRLGSARGILAAARARSTDAPSVLPQASMLPPGTPGPLLPTLRRRPRSSPTTTHDPARGGDARLVLAMGTRMTPADGRQVLWLNQDVTTIGSGPDCDVVLEGLAPLHAEVRHDERDEFVLLAHARQVHVHGSADQPGLLRTGTRVSIGPWQMSFYREEYADHGRPHGGRLGGEAGEQKPQDPRPAAPGPGF